MRTLRVILVALAMLSLCSIVSAAEFEENFESYAPGTQLHGQDGWEGWDNSPAAGALVSDAFAFSGSNSVEIGGGTDLVRMFDVTGGQWVFRTMMYIPSGGTANNFFIMLNQYTSGRNWSVQIPFRLGTGQVVSENLGSGTADIIYDEWVELRMMIDLDNNTVDEFYNGELLSSHVWQNTGTNTIEAIDLYSENASPVYYDNIVLQTLTEYLVAATNPSPADAATDVAQDVELSWEAGSLAVTHDVYFGTDYDGVASATRANPMGVLVSQNQGPTAYSPDGLLEFGQVYYWRIDEIQQDGTIDAGSVWSFTVEPVLYAVEGIVATTNGASPADQGPENTVNGSGLNENGEHSTDTTDMWLAAPGAEPLQIQFDFDRPYKLAEMHIWNHNFIFEMAIGLGIKDVTVEYSPDGTDWVVLGDVELGRANGSDTYTYNTTIPFDGVAAQSVRLLVNSSFGGSGQFGLSEVRFMYSPTYARYPVPADGAVNVDVTTDLSWRTGRGATSHDVNLGTDPAALAPAGTTTVASLTPDLDLDTAYSWQVVENTDGESWAGDIWSFTTQAYLVVDDFDQYDDDVEAGTTIWQGWIDGIDDPSNGGAVVGNAVSPFAEQTIVRSGQSLNLSYDNANTSAISEADKSLSPAQNWTAHGIKSLSLSFRGAAGNTGRLYVKINNGQKIPYDGDTADIGLAGWQAWSIDLSTAGNVSNVTALTIGVEGTGSGIVYVDNVHLSPKVPAPPASNIDIAISAQANWWSQAAADREMQEIVDNAQAPVVVFNASDQDGLAQWVTDHTNNGVANLLILCGQLPDTIYEPGNTQADDSLVELFLDAGNTVINTGDWIFYVVNGGGTNGPGGLQTIMDLPDVTVAGGDNTPVTVTAEGQALTPSLQNFETDRPFHLDTLGGDWSAELVLAQNDDGTLADPVIVRNSVTGGRIGVFHQTASQDDDPRGEVMSEWINNWYLDAVSGN